MPRTLETDAEGRYEATNLKPGTYRVEVVTTNFKKFERTGVLLRAAGTALVDVTLEVGGINETVTVVGRCDQQHHARQPGHRARSRRAAAPRPPAQQPRHPVVPAPQPQRRRRQPTTSSSWAARPTASRTSRTARPRRTPSSAPSATPRRASTRSRRLPVLSNSYSAEYGGLAGVVVTTKRGANSYRGTSFYDFNSDGLNALTYNQTLAGVERGDPLSDTHEHRWGGSIGGPLVDRQDCSSIANYEGSNNKAIFGGGRATVPTAAMRNGDFRGTAIAPRDPQHRPALPESGDSQPTASIRRRRTIMDFFYPLPNQGTLANGYGVYQQFVPETREPPARRHQNRSRGGQERHAVPPRQLSAPQSEQHHLRGRQRVHEPADPEYARSTPASVIGGWTKIFSPTIVNEFRAGYNYDNSGRESTFLAADVAAPARHRERAEPRRPTAAGSRRSSSRRERTGPPTSPMPAGTWTARFVRTPSRSATTSRGSRAATR